MILTGKKINEAVQQGDITISPYDVTMLNPNSYNYRLAPILYQVTDETIDPKRPVTLKKIVLNDEGYVLQPNILYLGATLEEIGSAVYVTSLIGRSSVGRLGLFLQITADMGNLGSSHCWTLEIKVVQPLRVYPAMKIGQVSFWKVSGDATKLYKNGYTKFSRPAKSKFFKEMTP